MTTPENNKVPFVSATVNGDDAQIEAQGNLVDCAALASALLASVLKDSFPRLPNKVLAAAGKESLKAALDNIDRTESVAVNMDAIEHGMRPN